MLENLGWQPFKKYEITIFKKKSTQNYMAFETKIDGSGSRYSEIIAKNENSTIVIMETQNYIRNKKLKPRKVDEEDIL